MIGPSTVQELGVRFVDDLRAGFIFCGSPHEVVVADLAVAVLVDIEAPPST